MSDNANNSLTGNTGAVLTNVNNIIQGSGQIGDGLLTFDNGVAGTIDATGSHAQLLLAGSIPIANAGLIESTGPSGLPVRIRRRSTTAGPSRHRSAGRT